MSDNLPSTLTLMKKYDLLPKKSFGQNFLLDFNITDKIVKYAGKIEDENILEIGPGPGSLTRSILKKNPKKLISVELDKRCFSLLNEIKSHYENFDFLEGDALKIDLKKLFNGEKFKVIANLPYNVGTPILFNFLYNLDYLISMTLMFQKEVVDRIVAKPRTKDYGRLSIICQALTNSYSCFDVSKEAFTPPPKVTSSIVSLTPKENYLDLSQINKLEVICKIFFAARRKTIKSNLKTYPELIKILESLNIDTSKRAEELSVEDYLNINLRATNTS